MIWAALVVMASYLASHSALKAASEARANAERATKLLGEAKAGAAALRNDADLLVPALNS